MILETQNASLVISPYPCLSFRRKRFFRLANSLAVFLLIKNVDRFEDEHFPGSRSSLERPLTLYSDNQDINVWLDKNALRDKGWTLDETPDLQVKWLPSCALIYLDAGITTGTFPP